MIRNRIKVLVALFIAILPNCSIADETYNTSFINKSETSITGYAAHLATSYSSQFMDNKRVLVTIKLEGKIIINNVNLSDKTFELKVFNKKTGKLTSLNIDELQVLSQLSTLLGENNTFPVQDILLRTIDLVRSTDPDGEDINFSSHKIKDILEKKNKIKPQVYTSLCPNIGETIIGIYTNNNQIIQVPAVIGPCYTDECLGRCGPGCNGSQVYTQQCFNHDLCTGATGRWFGPCKDEWLAAADGYLFAPNCANMSGQWEDSYGYAWSLVEEGDVISGTVNTDICGVWNVSGTRNNQNITITATNPAPPTDQCTTTFTYSGIAQCNSVLGSWTNADGLSGSWTMQRNSTVRTSPMNLFDHLDISNSPAVSKQGSL